MRKVAAYVLSFLLVSAITMVKYYVPALSIHTPLLLYYLAIILSAAFLGTGPAILSLVLSAGLIDYIFIHPEYYPDVHWAGILQILIYLIDGLVMTWVIHRLRQAERKLLAKNRSLQDSNDRVAKMLARILDEPLGEEH